MPDGFARPVTGSAASRGKARRPACSRIQTRGRTSGYRTWLRMPVKYGATPDPLMICPSKRRRKDIGSRLLTYPRTCGTSSSCSSVTGSQAATLRTVSDRSVSVSILAIRPGFCDLGGVLGQGRLFHVHDRGLPGLPGRDEVGNLDGTSGLIDQSPGAERLRDPCGRVHQCLQVHIERHFYFLVPVVLFQDLLDAALLFGGRSLRP